MKWIDYREKLGIGFNDNVKFNLLENKICTFIDFLNNTLYAGDFLTPTFIDYFIMVGETPSKMNLLGVSYSFSNSNSLKELISKYVAFSNTIHKHIKNQKVITIVKDFLFNEMENLNIDFSVVNDNDGIFIFPKGAKELDDALVSEPLEWLQGYPNAHKTFCIALKQYSEGIYIRDAADNLRKALEAFLQEFLCNDKNLESNKNDICKYLGGQNIDPGISGLFHQVINSYKSLNDRIVKHNDAVDKKILEFLLYQTGLLIRMVISVKNQEGEQSETK